MVAGYGAGKSHALILRTLKFIFGDGGNVAYYLPTYDLIKTIAYPRFVEVLDNLQVTYTLNKTDHIIDVNGKQIIFRTMDNPERIIGYEVTDSMVDELDTLQIDKARECWNKIIARNRQKKDSQNTVAVGTTPEGFRFVYEKWGKNPSKSYELIKAPTYSNPHLPDNYIDLLRETYPDNLLQAYIEGDFVNLTSGSVYANYDRTNSATTAIDNGSEPLHIGIDFNINHMAAVVSVKRDGASYAVNEIIDGRDTPAMISIINDQYPNRSIIVYPDASGSARKTTNASTSDITLLREAGFTVNAPSSNGLVKDRVAAYNRALCDNNNKRSFLVNAEKCPQLAAALEQQVYDKNGSPDKSGGIDHVLDASGYYLVRTYPIISHKMSTVHVRGF